MTSVAAARTSVTVVGGETTTQTKLPTVFLAPIRPDIVNFVHTSMNKNKRQAYAVDGTAGYDSSAVSWGTGRAVARIPRTKGSGNSASGQGTFGNMCRGGRMFGNTVQWRRWHRRINQNQRRYAVASAIAASALPSLVMARGHNISQVAEIPLVVSDSFNSLKRTKDAIAALKKVGAWADVEKVVKSRKLRAGSGKGRGRKYKQRKGPLIVYAQDEGLVRAVRNLPGVDTCHVSSLNLLQLAPGGHLGRFVIWTEGAFQALKGIWGTFNSNSSAKKGFTLPAHTVSNADITSIINSNAVQSVVRGKQSGTARYVQKKNPLKNINALQALNPYGAMLRRRERARQGADTKPVIEPFSLPKCLAHVNAYLTKLNDKELDVEDFMEELEQRWRHVDADESGLITYEELREAVWNAESDNKGKKIPEGKLPKKLQDVVDEIYNGTGRKENITFWCFVPFCLDSFDGRSDIKVPVPSRANTWAHAD